MMKFWIIVGVMLSGFTLNKARTSTSQCDKASFVESCKTLNITTKNISSICKKENVQNQTVTEISRNLTLTGASKTKLVPGTRKNEDFMDKLCSDMWSLCCSVSTLNLLHIVGANDSLMNDTEHNNWKNKTDGFNCFTEDFAKEMEVKNDTICEIQRSRNLSLPESARLVECVIQLWPLGKADILKDLLDIEKLLQNTKVETSEVLSENGFVALLYKHSGDFSRVEFSANESQISIGVHHNHSKMGFQLPEELGLSRNETLVFLTLQLPNQTAENRSMDLFERRLFGLSVSKRRVSRLREPANFTISFSPEPNRIPQCVFLDYSTKNWRSDGCRTVWESGQNSVRCLCDHFTYFGVLLVSSSLSPEDLKVLSYITSIGCGISLFALIPTAFLLFTEREIQTENSKKIHANLVIALILLNLHLLPSEMAAGSSSPGLCLYVALAIHYSLLATFCWMALEGFHLFLLMVKVFNIYINRYMLKISMVGWGVPALIVSVVVSIKRNFYGNTSLSQSSSMCYITDDTLKYTTSLGVLSLVLLFNMFTFVETVRYMFAAKTRNKRNLSEVKRDSITLMILTTLLGLTWGFIFFSFGTLSTPGLYIFSIFNSLQGFFIFIFIGLSLRKSKSSGASSSSSSS